MWHSTSQTTGRNSQAKTPAPYPAWGLDVLLRNPGKGENIPLLSETVHLVLGAVPPKSMAQLQATESGLPGPGTELRIWPKGWILSPPPSLDWATHRPAYSLPPTSCSTHPPRSTSCHPPRVLLPAAQGWPYLWAQEMEHRGQSISVHWLISEIVQSRFTAHLRLVPIQRWIMLPKSFFSESISIFSLKPWAGEEHGYQVSHHIMVGWIHPMSRPTSDLRVAWNEVCIF